LYFPGKDLGLGILYPETCPHYGLRAFAEALGIQNNTEGSEYDILDPYSLRIWKERADEVFENIRSLKTGNRYFDEVKKERSFSLFVQSSFSRNVMFRERIL
jgi:hypothetical protein